MAEDEFKRHTAFKMRIGDISEGKVILNLDKFKSLEYKGKEIVRVNLIANVIDKYIQDSEKKFGSLTLDDASGQIKAKTFGEDIEIFSKFEQGDTVQLIGVLRTWNNETYVLPEILKKKEPAYLLVRKLELDIEQPKELPAEEQSELKNQIIQAVKDQENNGGVEVESLITNLKSPPDAINTEVHKLLEEGIIYEPRPGKIRYLG